MAAQEIRLVVNGFRFRIAEVNQMRHSHVLVKMTINRQRKMDTGLRITTAKVDPNKWKPLWRLFPAVLAALALAIPLIQMLPDVLAGHTRYLIETIIYGVAVLALLYAISANVWQWWHRPTGEDAILQAATQVARILPDTKLVCRAIKRPLPNKVIYAASPVTFFLISVYWAFIDNWPGCLGFFGLAIFMAGLFWYLFTKELKTRDLILTFDPAQKVVSFKNFSFATEFLPQKPRPLEEIPFDQILDCTFYPGEKGGPPLLRIKTTRGPTEITERMEYFDTIRTLFESIVTLNLADPEQREANLQSVPRVVVPWYGWLMITGAFGGLGILIWALLTKL